MDGQTVIIGTRESVFTTRVLIKILLSPNCNYPGD